MLVLMMEVAVARRKQGQLPKQSWWREGDPPGQEGWRDEEPAGDAVLLAPIAMGPQTKLHPIGQHSCFWLPGMGPFALHNAKMPEGREGWRDGTSGGGG